MNTKTKVENWFEKERKKGLVDVKLFASDTSRSSRYSLNSEIHSIHKALEEGRHFPFED